MTRPDSTGGGVHCPPILSREEIARRRREDEQRRLRVVAHEPQGYSPEQLAVLNKPDATFARVRKSRA